MQIYGSPLLSGCSGYCPDVFKKKKAFVSLCLHWSSFRLEKKNAEVSASFEYLLFLLIKIKGCFITQIVNSITYTVITCAYALLRNQIILLY